MFNAHRVNASLNAAEIATLAVVITDEPELEDDEINVTDTITVQVGESYLGVTVDNGDGTFMLHPYTSKLSDIKKILKRLL